jgi:type IV pilus assembly protein PilY1
MSIRIQTGRAVIATAVIFAHPSLAAMPPIALENDPRLVHCASAPPGSPTVSGLAVSDTEGYAYEAAFDSTNWSGNISKRRLGFGEDGNAMVQDAEWDAATLLNGADPQARRIYTLGTGTAPRTIPFLWERLSASQKALLDRSPLTGKSDGLGERRLQYLRGDRRLETGTQHGMFRSRSRVLGDIVNSTPMIVGAPSATIQDAGYQVFYESNRNRPPAVFVGANDSMLHAFDAADGHELFAYVPQSVFSQLAQLTRTDYKHHAYVDGKISASEAQLAGEWKTVLVAAMRGGAQGVFALDVTDAGRVRQPAALWEFTDADDPHMGNVTGAPAVAKFRIGMHKGQPVYRYFAVVAGGVNNYVDDGAGHFDPRGPSALFFLALDKPLAEKWKAGSNYYKFLLASADGDVPSGLGEPAIVKTNDGAVRYVYAGDLQGNVWRLDFTGTAPWTGAVPAKPVFSASDAQGRRQPIVQKPAVVFASEGYLLLVGTGRLLEAGDLQREQFQMQSFYAVQDTPDRRGEPIRRSQLAERTLSMRMDGLLEIGGRAPAHGAGNKGWYVDFIDGQETGERVLRPAEVVGNRAYFVTAMPTDDACRSTGGRSYIVDTLNGLPPDTVITGYPVGTYPSYGPIAMPIAPPQIAPRDATGKRKIKNRIGALGNERDASVAGKPETGGRPDIEQITTAGRLSWRELVNWSDVHKPSK